VSCHHDFLKLRWKLVAVHGKLSKKQGDYVLAFALP
jgi:hypothetical protein